MNKKERLAPDFIQVPKIVMHLAPADRFVFGVIYFLCGLSQKKCTASNAYIGEIAHVGAETVTNSLNRLESEGFIKRYFKDNNKRTRDYIICLVRFTKIPSNDGIDTTKRLDEMPSGDGQIYNSNIEKNKDIADKPLTTDFSSKDELLKWKASNQRWLHILGVYGLWRKVDTRLTTKATLNKLIPEFRKIAVDLSDFTDNQLRDAFVKCDEMKDKEGKGFDWTLRTIKKVLLK